MLAVKNEERCKQYMNESQLLHNAQTLRKSLLEQRVKMEVAFMDAVRVMLVRLRQNGTKITKHEIKERISNLLEQSIQSQGVQLLT